MFAGFEAILTLGVAAGSLVAPLIIDLIGVRPALVVVGLLAPLAVTAGRPALRRIDATVRVRDADVATLRSINMLGVLPLATIEQLAGVLDHAELAPGQTATRQGEPGEHFYIVRSGRAEVLVDGRVVTTLGPGECFGEIALLQDRPRTATVRASVDGCLQLSRLRRSAYLTAVTGYPAAAAAGDDLVTSRLGADAQRPAVSGLGGDAPRSPEAQHVRHPAPGDVERPGEPPQPAGVDDRGR
jgi:hypothetical protein